MWSAGQRVGEYELIAKLREGGMATLFLARRSGVAGFLRHVAIKVIHPNLADDVQFRQMFLDEARVSSRIQHPNVVQVEELGSHQGAHYLCMEFVHGCSLSQLQRALLARGRRLAPAFAVRIAIEIAEGLHAAHETCDEQGRPLNVVHRDVTPENILLAYGGHVKLIDFGIAKAYGRRHRTQDGLLKGKFRYMAPEQAFGRPIDRRVDIYQLGIVLWEMLTLRRLFDAARDVDLLASVQKPHIVPPGAWVDRIPAALDAAVMAALEPQAKQRPADAQTFARLLAKAVPSAHEVDSGALRALLLATMRERRQQDRATYPPGIYDRLEAATPAPGVAVHSAPDSTVEHTTPYGSDSSSPSPSAERPTRGGLGRARMLQRARERRPRRLVQLALELRTSLTQLAELGMGGSRAYWLSIGTALGLTAALVLIALTMNAGVRPARLPELPLVLPRAPQVEARPAAELTARSDAGASPAEADAGVRHRSRLTRRAPNVRRAPARAVDIVTVDGIRRRTAPESRF